MKLLVFSLYAIIPAFALLADVPDSHKLDTPQKRAAYSKMKKREAVQRLGGMMIAPVKGKVVRVANLQNKIPLEEIRKTASLISQVTTVGCEIVDSEPSDNRTAAVIRLIDKTDAPSLLVAPENFWSELNVATLISDNPSDEVFLQRFKKEFCRVFCMTLGAGNSVYQPCLMRNVSSLKELDSINSNLPCPQAIDIVQRTADIYKFGRYRLATYHTACKEGWAPAPTNDIQKAIWDKVHAMPTEPIKIKPETKKVRE